MKKRGWLIVVAVLLVVVSATVIAGDDPKKEAADHDAKAKAELKWARGVAMDFLKAAIDEKESAKGLLSHELAVAIQERDKHDRSTIEMLAWYSEPTITSEEIAPNGSEVVFTAMLKGNKQLGTHDADCKVRVVKEPNGRWSIRFIEIKEREVKKNPADADPKAEVGS